MEATTAQRERSPYAERQAHVMGTDAHVIVVAADADALADLAIERLRALEARWSRFLPSSEISRLNERPGVPVLVAPETFQLIEHALAAWSLTEGKFDPTVLADLRAEGYDRSFELLGLPEPDAAAEPAGAERSFPRSAPAPRAQAPDVRLDRIVGTVRLGAHTTFDAGGIGKGFAADLVVDELLFAGASGVMVSVGGDLRAAGAPPTGESWVVAVADPLDPDRVIGEVCLGSGAVASSWRTKRSWVGRDGRPRHHLIDPRTGRSASTGVAGVTVVAAEGWRAEVLAKAAFLAGPADGAALIARAGAAGLVVADDGTVLRAGNVDDFLRSPVV